MMTRAYDKFFLPGVMKNLGFAVDFAVNGCGVPADSFYDFFIASKVAKGIEEGSPLFICGCSGTELALSVFERVGFSDNLAAADSFVRFERSPEYWAGWILAFYQWEITCVYYEEYSEQNYPEDSSLTFEAADLGITQEVKIDLLPYLREYGKTSDGVKAPEDASVYSTLGDVNYARSVKVLEDTDPLNVNLYKDVYLTGIGWINDQLHVRIQDRQQEKITIGPMSVPPAFLSVALS